MTQEYCENCGVSLQGDYCHSCGQERQSSSRFFGSILMDLLDNLFNYDSRVYKTFVPLMLKPGYVCSEYLSGKRARFLPPFRLYLFASVIFFLIVPLVNDSSVSFNNEGEDAEEVLNLLAQSELDKELEVIELEKEMNDDNITIPFFEVDVKKFREKFERIREDNSGELLKTVRNSLPTTMFFYYLYWRLY